VLVTQGGANYNVWQAKGWDVAPNLIDGQDAMMMFIFCWNGIVAWYAIQMAMFVAAGGYEADDEFTEGAMAVLGTLFFAFFLGVLIPLMAMVVWHVFTDAASPYAALGCATLLSMLNRPLYGKLTKFQLDCLPLEFYHSPKLLQRAMAYVVPWHRKAMQEKVIRPKAEKRAAKLHAMVPVRHVTKFESPADIRGTADNASLTV